MQLNDFLTKGSGLQIILGAVGRAEVEWTVEEAYSRREEGHLSDGEEALVEFVGFTFAHILCCM